jgi:thioredoxin reductase
MAKRLSSHVTIYTNGNKELAEATKPLIKSSKISYDARKITKLALLHPDQHSSPVIITFEDGTTKTETFIASHPRVEQTSPLAAQLGLEMQQAMGGEAIVTHGPVNETSVGGVFAAGDAATAMKSVVQALQMGVFAATGAVAQLQREKDDADEL